MKNRYEIMAEAFRAFQDTDDVSDKTKMEKLYKLWIESDRQQKAVIDMVFIELCGYSFHTIAEEGRKGGDIYQNII